MLRLELSSYELLRFSLKKPGSSDVQKLFALVYVGRYIGTVCTARNQYASFERRVYPLFQYGKHEDLRL